MAKKTDFPRHGRIKTTGQMCVITGESSWPGTPCWTVKFTKRSKEVFWSKGEVVVLGKVDTGWDTLS
jgi:hypothetical protein